MTIQSSTIFQPLLNYRNLMRDKRLLVVGKVESAVEVGLVRAERLRLAILKHAFEGKL